MMSFTDKCRALSVEFPREVIHWRPGATNKEKTKALALAYIDSRDVQDRLDEVFGPGGWQSRHFAVDGRVGCSIGIWNEDLKDWVWKSDGAGDTDIEGEKGSFSDALKRAAVSWGVGRYLYRLDAKWLPCEFNGKYFKKWNADPWTASGMKSPVQDEPQDIKGGKKNKDWTCKYTKGELQNFYKTVAQDLASEDIEDVSQLVELMKGYQGEIMDALKSHLPSYYDNTDIDQPGLKQLYLRRMKQLENK